MDDIKLGKTISRFLGSENSEDQISLVNELAEVDYSKLVNYLRYSNLESLFYVTLRSIGIEITNFSVLIFYKMHEEYVLRSAVTMKRSFEIKNILNQFQKNGIDIILLKGAYVAEKLYLSHSLRPMCDIDILVREKDLNKTINIFRDLGYITYIDSADKADGFYEKHLPKFEAPNKMPVEVHFSISHKFNQSIMKDIWLRTIKERLYGLECSSFLIEDLFLYLSSHLADDNYGNKLIQLYDIHLLLQKCSINCQFVILKAEQLNIQKSVICTLLFLINNFKTKIPNKLTNWALTFNYTKEIDELIERCVFIHHVGLDTEDVKLIEFLQNKTLSQKAKKLVTIFNYKKNFVCYYKIKPGSFKAHFWFIYKIYDMIIKYMKPLLANTQDKNRVDTLSISKFNANEFLTDWFKK